MAGLLDPDSVEAQAIANMDPYEALKLALGANRAYTPQQVAANNSANTEELLRNLPITGQAAGLKDAWDASGRGGNAVMSGHFGDALHEYGNMGVGLLTGLLGGRSGEAPVEGASSRAGVFVPAMDADAAGEARRLKTLREGAATDTTVRRKTGITFSPGGEPLSEIYDYPMTVNHEAMQPGSFGPLSNFIDHPELFKQYPSLAEHPTLITDKMQRVGDTGRKAIYRTVGDASENDMTDAPVGAFAASMRNDNPNQAKGGFAKLLQYQIDKDTGQPPAVRHGYDDIKQQFRDALKGIPEGDYPPEQLAAYKASLTGHVDKMKAVRSATADELRDTDPSYVAKSMRAGALYGGQFNAGNALPRIAAFRATRDPKVSEEMHPYNSDPQLSTRSGKGVRISPDIAVLPPSNSMGPNEFREFLDNWYKYGAGLPAGAK